MSSPMPLSENQPESKETWISFDGYIADYSFKEALLRSNRKPGGAILVMKGDYKLVDKTRIILRFGVKVSIVEQPNALPHIEVDLDCGISGSTCIGGDKVCCAEPQTIVDSCDYDWSFP